MTKVQAFTPTSVDNLRSGKLTDPRTPGLTVEVGADGKKVWRYKRRISGSGTILKLTLGSYPAFTIAAARTWADPLNAQVERGEDLLQALRVIHHMEGDADRHRGGGEFDARFSRPKVQNGLEALRPCALYTFLARWPNAAGRLPVVEERQLRAGDLPEIG